MGAPGFRGGRRMSPGSAGSSASASAGAVSVTRLSQRIWIGFSGSGKPAAVVPRIMMISARLQLKR